MILWIAHILSVLYIAKKHMSVSDNTSWMSVAQGTTGTQKSPRFWKVDGRTSLRLSTEVHRGYPDPFPSPRLITTFSTSGRERWRMPRKGDELFPRCDGPSGLYANRKHMPQVRTRWTKPTCRTKDQQKSNRRKVVHLKSLTSPRASDVAKRLPSSERQHDVTSRGEVASAGHTPLTWPLQRPDHVAQPDTGSTACSVKEHFWEGVGGEGRGRRGRSDDT